MKKIFCFDIDGVICITKKSNYKKAKPNRKAILFINHLYEIGHEIKIFTARYMGRNFENNKKAYKQGYNLEKDKNLSLYFPIQPAYQKTKEYLNVWYVYIDIIKDK